VASALLDEAAMLRSIQSWGAGLYVSNQLQERYRMGINTLFCPN